MSTELSVVLVHRNDIERTQLRSALESLPGVQIAGERSDLRSGMALAHQVEPSILLLELAGSGDEALQAASQYRLQHPDVVLFLSTDQFNPETLVRAMHAGAQEVLRRPLDREALSAAVERVAAFAARKHGGGTSRSVITVFSNKGGVGVSTLATNLAVSIRRQSGREVALADFDYQSGDVASMLGLAPARTIGDVLSAARIDSASVQDVMLKHASGVSVLSQPEQIERVDGVMGHQVGSVLEILGATYEVVVVDAPHLINDIALEIFDRSSIILVVAELSLPSVRAARRSLDIFHKLNFMTMQDRVRLVLNRASEHSAISRAQIEETLGMRVFCSIANDYAAVSQAINLGRPLCVDSPKSRAGRDLDGLARELIPVENATWQEEEAAPRRPRLRLFGKG